jgi:hypothetical protein
LALRRHLPRLAALAAMSLAAAACGGSSGDQDEERVREVIEGLATEPDPGNCTELATQKFLDQVEAPDGEEAVESCEQAAEEEADDFADAAEVSEIEIEDGSATASVSFEGGVNDGQQASVTLVDEDDEWKLDSLEDLEIDRARFEAALRSAVATGQQGFTKGDVECMIRRLERVGTSELEASGLDAERMRDLLGRPLIACVGGGDPRAGVLEIARRSLVREGGLTHAQADCVVRRLRDDVNSKDVGDVLGGRPLPGLTAAAQAAARKCVIGNAPVPPEGPEGDEPTL